jgi:excisionase family DNA binding protein
MATAHGKKDGYLTPHEAAERLMVSPVTLRHWSLEGKLDFVTTPGGHRRYALEEVERFAREHRMRPALPAVEPRRVLLVEDNALVSDYLKTLFAGVAEAVQSEVACDNFEAGCKLVDFRPHVVLLDLATTGCRGFGVCRRIKEHPATCHTRVVMIAGSRQEEEIRQAEAVGAEACLIKPLELDQLFAALGLEDMVSA